MLKRSHSFNMLQEYTGFRTQDAHIPLRTSWCKTPISVPAVPL